MRAVPRSTIIQQRFFKRLEIYTRVKNWRLKPVTKRLDAPLTNKYLGILDPINSHLRGFRLREMLLAEQEFVTEVMVNRSFIRLHVTDIAISFCAPSQSKRTYMWQVLCCPKVLKFEYYQLGIC